MPAVKLLSNRYSVQQRSGHGEIICALHIERWRAARVRLSLATALLIAFCFCALSTSAQTNELGATLEQDSQAANNQAPLTLTLSDAVSRAQKNSPQFQAALSAVKAAHYGQIQARAAMLPNISNLTQYLNTQGNGISPVGRFVTNDGVHVYREWGVVHQDLPASFFLDLGQKKSAYEKAVAQAGAEVARRSLVVTVTQDYYALIVAEHAYGTAQQSLANAQHFLKTSQALEQGGEVSHQDVIRFELESSLAERNLGDAQLAMSQARLNLAVLLFPTFNQNFTVVDDLDTPPVLPGFQQAEAMAKDHNPELAAALASYHASRVDVASARSEFFPSASIDFDYGIEANAFALNSVNDTKPGVLQPNVGYFVTYSVTIPVWDWGVRLSHLHHAEDQRELAKLDVSFTQRQIVSLLHSYYDESQLAWNQLENLRGSVDLAQQNLRLVTLQYQTGETSVLQVLDAETSLATARDSYAAGEAKYRNALATLQTITGSF